MTSNFSFLTNLWPRLARFGEAAEACYHASPAAFAARLNALASEIAGCVLRYEKAQIPEPASLAAYADALTRQALLPGRIADILAAIDRSGGCTTLSDGRREALLRLAGNLALWFMQVYADPDFAAGDFVLPRMCGQDEALERAAAIDCEIAALPAELPDAPGLLLDAVSRLERSAAAADRLSFTPQEQLLLQSGKISIALNVVGVVNYALQQNRMPMLQSLKIINRSDRAIENAELRLSAVPAFCAPIARTLTGVAPDSRIELTDLPLSLDADYLSGLTEKVSGVLTASLWVGDDLLCSASADVTALAFDEWHGYGFYPELLTAFITPNHPEIARLTARAAELLEKWTGDPSLDAYQSNDANRVLAQAAAVYGALQERNIVYAVPPASFERTGQRVRLCDTVMEQKLGCCLDLTLVFAAALEAIGLNPLLIIKRGHIFAGLWLDDLTFPDSVQDDPSLVTKRTAEGVSEIALVETTFTAAGKHAGFDEARAEAGREMNDADDIECIIDVRRARLSGISPLPMRVHTAQGWRIDRAELSEADLTAAPSDVANPLKIEEAAAEAAFPKMVQWERKLLDLGLRNALINLRLSKSMIPILSTSLDELENALSGGSDFSIAPRPADWHISDGQIAFETAHDLAGQDEIIKADFKNRRLRSLLNEADLTAAIKDLYRSAKTALEENGANTLYLALGLLKWYESDRSAKARYAPLVLLPVEIVRKGAQLGYIIRLRDEDPQMNITVLEKLKQDFKIVVSGLDPLPQDDHGIDTRKVFTILRKAIMGQPRWDVLESAYLGTFSFSQFVMWNDIRNRADDLMQSKLVRSLMDSRLAWDAEDMHLPARVEEGGVLLPIPADASQLFAIRSACEGKSFVLHGPPGTGKSQTITALIANALAQGKTVLFVAEKMAALEVVQKRLSAIGIGPFCLELHSNKSKKRDLLEQLRQAAEVTRTKSSEEYARRAEKIAELRTQLDRYAAALHKTQPCGMSVYQLINAFEAHSETVAVIPFPAELIQSITAEQLDDQLRLVQRLISAARSVGHPCGHPLAPVRCTRYSVSLKHALPDCVAAYKSALTELRSGAASFSKAVGVGEPGSREELASLNALAEELWFWVDLPGSWTSIEHPNQYFDGVRRMARHYIRAAELREKLEQLWQDSFFDLSGSQLLSEYNVNAAKWFLPKLISGKNFSKRLAVHAKCPIPEGELLQHITDLVTMQREKLSGDKLYALYGDSLSGLVDGSDTDWRRLIAVVSQAEDHLRIPVSPVFHSVRSRLGTDSGIKERVKSWRQVWLSAASAGDALNALLQIEPSDADNWIEQQLLMCSDILANADSLKEWFAWNHIAAEASAHGLQPVVDAYRGGLAHEIVSDAYEQSIYRQLAIQAIEQDVTLNLFSGALFNEQIEQFRKLDQELAELAREEIFCRLAAKVPNFAREAAQSSELGILQRAIRSGGRGVSIRRLFEQIPNLLPRLCPCMLMSPISAAQYLDPNREPFDIVVFDEASQLPTCKAVGVLARGVDAVIVGDPKQMPPTTFFDSNRVDEDHLETEDLESILDDCLALSMPQTHLLWHYRSRHESLIAFSNRQFYENKLYTFPSVNDRERKVRLVPVDGLFDRGKSRTNRAEAEAIVEELKRRCHDPILQNLSVGVVTFNISQQHLVDDLLLEACRTDEALEAWAYGASEPVFIKNLENVQGDERDVILFSISYGPDATGRVSMNFGPLNRTGGWRRLNVAVTRARQEMIVFSTLRPEQINLTRSSALGVAALKKFLEYASGEELTGNEPSAASRSVDADGVANEICRELSRFGYATQQHVGHSEYRIDIGVVDADRPGHYRLGILLDGDSYGSARTARDRELSQISVLNGLGWKILRVWTMDWYDNSRKEIHRILDALRRTPPGGGGSGDDDGGDSPLLLVNPTGSDPDDAGADAMCQLLCDSADGEAAPPAPGSDGASTDALTAEPSDAAPSVIPSSADTPPAPLLPELLEPETPSENPAETVEPELLLQGNHGARRTHLYHRALPDAAVEQTEPDVRKYAATNLPIDFISSEDFLLPACTPSIKRKIEQVIVQEAPISEGLMTRRILQSFGITRNGSRLQARMDAVYAAMRLRTTVHNGERFFWDLLQDPDSYPCFRTNGEGINHREAKEIPLQEAANAVCRVLEDQVSLAGEDLQREAARLMGFSRASAALTSLFSDAIELAQADGRITRGVNGSWIPSRFA